MAASEAGLSGGGQEERWVSPNTPEYPEYTGARAVRAAGLVGVLKFILEFIDNFT